MSKEAIQTIHLKESVSESAQFNSCIVTFNNINNIKLLYLLVYEVRGATCSNHVVMEHCKW